MTKVVFLVAVIVMLLLAAAQSFAAEPQSIRVHRALAVDRRISSQTKGKTAVEVGARKYSLKSTMALFDPTRTGFKSVGSALLITDLGAFPQGYELPAVGMDAFLAQSSTGHLVVLPETQTRASTAFLAALDKYFATGVKLDLGIYVADGSDPALVGFMHSVRQAGPMDELLVSLELVDPTPGKEKVPPATELQPFATPDTVANVLSFFGGRKELSSGANAKTALKTLKKDSKDLPNIVIAMNGDTFGVAPSLAPGGGAAVAVFNELARLTGNLYRSQLGLRKNLIFLNDLLGRVNYAGSAAWIEQLDTATLEETQVVLCLDDLLAAEVEEGHLYFHVSRSGAKDPAVKAVQESLKTVAHEGGKLKLEVNLKKINVSHHEVHWQHQIFSYRSVFGGTLSSMSSPPPQMTRNSLSREEPVLASDKKITALKTTTHFLVQWLLQQLELPASTITEDEISVSHLTAWFNAAESYARPSSAPVATNSFLQSLQDAMQLQYGAPSTNQQKGRQAVAQFAKIGPSKKGNDAAGLVVLGPLEVFLTLHTAKAFFFELGIFAAIAGYLFCLAFFLFGSDALIALGIAPKTKSA